MAKSKQAEVSPVKRAALYIRVSTDEQAIRGLSLEAQQEDLQAFAKERGWVIQGVYVDAAKTARKRLHKRENFRRMLEAVERGEVDVILFTRLDRWFRSVADYYKVMEVLEAHGCGWMTTQEQYDTTTAGGRLYINLRLSIAQNEADLCGERIGAVFDSKIRHGTAICGKIPYGYRIGEDKRLEVVPERAAVVVEAFEHYRSTVSFCATAKYIRETYGVNWAPLNCGRLLRNRLYIGDYDRRGRVNHDFCPPIVSRELFEEVQNLMPSNVKFTPSGRVYLFSSILICGECGRRLSAHASPSEIYYRCPNHVYRGRCPREKEAKESVVEAWLLEHIGEVLEQNRFEWERKEETRQKSAAGSDRASIKRKLKKLKEMYLDDKIDRDEYYRDYDLYTSMLEERQDLPQEPRPNFEAVEALLANDYRSVYDGMSRADKRTVWHSIIREIHIASDGCVSRVVFL